MEEVTVFSSSSELSVSSNVPIRYKRCLDEDSSASTIEHEHTSRRKRALSSEKYSDRRLKIYPRVLKRDIRRNYATMLVNVMNSYEVEMMVKFFSAFCVRSCYLYDDSTEALAVQPISSVNNSISIRRVRGPEYIALHLLRGMDLVPDCTIKLLAAEIRQGLEPTGSQVVCRVQINGTKLFSYAVAAQNNQETILYETQAQATVFRLLRLMGGAAAALRMQDIAQYFQKVVSHRPQSVHFNATITLHLDKDHRIDRLNFSNSLEVTDPVSTRNINLQ